MILDTHPSHYFQLQDEQNDNKEHEYWLGVERGLNDFLHATENHDSTPVRLVLEYLGVEESSPHFLPSSSHAINASPSPSANSQFACIQYNLQILAPYIGSFLGLVTFFMWNEPSNLENDILKYSYLVASILSLVIFNCCGLVLSTQVFASVQDEDETRYFCYCLPWPLTFLPTR